MTQEKNTLDIIEKSPNRLPVGYQDILDYQKRIEAELQIDVLRHFAEEFEVRCEDDARQALAMALQSRKLEKNLEESRAEITRPHLDYQRAINKMVKSFQSQLEMMEKGLHIKLESWMLEQADNPFTAIDEIKVDDGILYTQKSWVWELINREELPPEYLQAVINEDKIGKDVQNGVRAIPGIKIYQKSTTKLRIKNS